MTSIDVNDVLKRTQSTANGSTTDFSFSFQVNNTNEIKVYEDSTLKTEGTHYDIVDSSAASGLNANGTGVVKFKTSPTDYTPANNKVITILSVMSIARASVYTSGGNITAASLEADFDKLHRVVGDFREVKSRTLIAPEYSPTDIDMTIPSKASRLGKILSFNSSTGNPEVTFTVADGLTLASVSADIATLADIEDGTDATDAIQTVAGIQANVTTVANISSNVTTVAGIQANVTTVAGKASLITSDFASDMALIDSTFVTKMNLVTSDFVTDMAVVTTDFISDLNDLATTSIIADLDLLATSDFISDLNAVEGIKANVTTVANNISDVTTVADNISTISAKAPLASPALTGNPTAPTQSASDNSTKIATTAYVDNQVATENTISEMDDVTITSIGDNEILQYNSSTSKFENQTLAEAGILTGNQTITLSGDVSGSGTTSIAVTIADDSHNHTIANIDDLQTTLDAKSTASKTETLTNKSIAATQLTGTVANARLDQQLQDVAGLAVTNGNFIVGDGSNFVAENPSTARTSLGLGTSATTDTGISNGNVPVFTSGVADDDFLRVNGTNIEGRSASQLASDINAVTAGFAIAMAVAL